MAIARIGNRSFRRLLLSLNGLSPAPARLLPVPGSAAGAGWTHGMVRQLGFVQVDPIVAIERAHQHILFSRNPDFEQRHLTQCLEAKRTLFEGWTHDAAILPVQTYPYWKHYFARSRDYRIHPGYERYFAPVTRKDITQIRRRIEKDGPLRPRDLPSRKADWGIASAPTPSVAKLTMEYLWRAGELSVCRRDRQEKVYDLSERVIPAAHFKKEVTPEQYVDFACRQALLRLGAGTPVQIARFFQAVSKEEARAWCEKRLGRTIIETQVMHADGSTSGTVFALRSMLEKLSDVPTPPAGLRLLNPFDPLIHDRQRTRRIFGFDYAIEIWVPPNKRKYGYYVLPILEGDRFTGRLDAKVDRKTGRLTVSGLWWEPGVAGTKTRMRRLDRKLRQLAAFTGVDELVYSNDFART